MSNTTPRTVPGTGNALLSRFHLGGSGPTVAIKDCIDIAGQPTCGGSAALADAPAATAHADVVRKLLEAGWQITARANMHELAYGMTGINDWNGTAVNPQDASRMTGGSSSGSASAVGAGLVDMSIGSDTGGSIRLPAACCGVIGLKPTFGRVSRAGAYPTVSSLDCVGPFARSMDLIISAMASIAPGFDRAAATAAVAQAGVKLVTVQADPEIAEAVAAAFAASGWQGAAWTPHHMHAAFEAGMTLINRETHDAFGHLLGLGQLGADIEKRLSAAATTSDEAVAQAEAVRAAFSAEVDAALADADALLLPTLPALPPTLAAIGQGASVLMLSSLVRPFNLSGHPALSIPVPIAGSPLKAGLQLVGRKGDDERICALGLHLERVLSQQA
ncbi:amidase [uncultured Herbaspirillum sp.]|uniref:amidase family protein n=1 Tax=uncultured Herbaspirillum sp. TaxID=160236 RepID=UPI002621C40A|nr:amidase [uncultured Herbaspirillum sp.]